MRGFETRRCPKCGRVMGVVDDSERTSYDKVWFWLRCPSCLHTELDWMPRGDHNKDYRK